MNTLGFPELMLILLVVFIVFVVFGPKNLPKLGKMFGSTMKEVRKGMSDFSEEINAVDEDSVKPQVGKVVLGDDGSAQAIDPNRKVAQVVYADEVEQQEVAIDPNRPVAQVVYADEVDAS